MDFKPADIKHSLLSTMAKHVRRAMLPRNHEVLFPYTNKLNRHIMDTEKVHSIKHCHVDAANYANPINCACDGPEGGHKTWVHQQGLRTNQGSSSAKTLMTPSHSLNKEACQLL